MPNLNYMFLFIMSNDNVKIRLCIKRPRICVHFHRNLNQVCILFNIYISLHSLIYIHILLCKKYVCVWPKFLQFLEQALILKWRTTNMKGNV